MVEGSRTPDGHRTMAGHAIHSAAQQQQTDDVLHSIIFWSLSALNTLSAVTERILCSMQPNIVLSLVKGKESGGGGGESVKREVQTETIGRGPNAVTRTTIIETRTTRDGRTQTTTTVNETKGSSDTFNDAALQVRCPMLSVCISAPSSSCVSFVRYYVMSRRRYELPTK